MMSLPQFQTPWFICTMATGISTSILYDYPYPARWLRSVSYVMFALCSVSLLVTAVLFAGQLSQSRQYRHDVLFDLNNNVFVACGVMGLISWVTAMHLVTEHKAPLLSYVLWWICNLLSLGTGWIIFLCIIWRSRVLLSTLTATLLLPIVSFTVTASAGGVIAPSLPPSLRESTIVISFLLWANAIGLAFIVLTVYTHRLIEHKFPVKEAVFTSFIPIGFLGQGAFAIQLFGRDYYDYLLLVDPSSQVQADILKYSGVVAGLFLEGLGFCFTVMAIWAVLSHGQHKFHFGWWATTFPLGTICLATHQTGSIMEWNSFLAISAIYGTFVVLFTVLCLCMSTREVLLWTRTDTADSSKSDEDTLPQHTAQAC